MIKKLRVTVDGKPYEVTVELSDEPESTNAAPAATPAAPPVIAAPRQTPPPPPPVPVATTAPAAAGAGSVVSPLAGLVVQVAVTAGQDVKEGDKVLTLEAMKMNTVVNAPKSGKVSEIKVVVGDAVSEGQVLAVIS